MKLHCIQPQPSICTHELYSENEWFGSLNMTLFVGDLQLPSVAGSPVFDKVSTKSLLNQLGAASSNIWRDCVTYERQKNCLRYT